MPYKDNLLALPGIYYAWAENILEKSSLQRLDDPETQKEDLYQNMVLNVNLGLSSYGYLGIFAQMNIILQQKKLKTAQYLQAKSEFKK